MLTKTETPTSRARPGLRKCALRDGESDLGDSKPNHRVQELTALLHVEGQHGLYGASFGGERLVHRSRTAELDLCRILADRGLTGALHVLDAKTGSPRFTITDIERAAGYTVEEGPNGPRFMKKRGRADAL